MKEDILKTVGISYEAEKRRESCLHKHNETSINDDEMVLEKNGDKKIDSCDNEVDNPKKSDNENFESECSSLLWCGGILAQIFNLFCFSLERFNNKIKLSTYFATACTELGTAQPKLVLYLFSQKFLNTGSLRKNV